MNEAKATFRRVFFWFFIASSLCAGYFFWPKQNNIIPPTFTLYSNSIADRDARIHIATFDSLHRDSDGYSTNGEECLDFARYGSIAAHKFKKEGYGYWCEIGDFRPTGNNPRYFLENTP